MPGIKIHRGLCRATGRAVDGWEAQNVQRVYEGLLAGVDWETGKRRGVIGKARKVKAGAARQETVPVTLGLSMPELLMSRVRAFSESLVLGSKDFVEEVFQANRSFFGAKRQEGARRMPQCAAPFYVARRVRAEGSG